MVWLSFKNIKSTRPTIKISESVLVPFPILKKVITHAYHFNGNPSTQYSIFAYIDPVKTIIIVEEEEWEVSQILDAKINRGKLWYLVEWKCFSQDPERSTWESTENLQNCPELVKDFHYL
ncbi:hypothetical protein O181_031523 [Austropuccinia psidii MF-1]|uniref:Chromo domain-containing protein n=1 Tax=Austropuccinia psidii MF-1 TaxID=1389203 RepID=A0A9Q3CXM9_9BASI|nr:hypothetical protein [Austropuccinia psidii MF-1]